MGSEMCIRDSAECWVACGAGAYPWLDRCRGAVGSSRCRLPSFMMTTYRLATVPLSLHLSAAGANIQRTSHSKRHTTKQLQVTRITSGTDQTVVSCLRSHIRSYFCYDTVHSSNSAVAPCDAQSHHRLNVKVTGTVSIIELDRGDAGELSFGVNVHTCGLRTCNCSAVAAPHSRPPSLWVPEIPSPSYKLVPSS